MLKKISKLIKCKPNGESDFNLNQIMEEFNKGNKSAIFKSYPEDCEKNKGFMSHSNGIPEVQGDMRNHDYQHTDISGYQNIQDMNHHKRKIPQGKSNVKLQHISDLGNSDDDFEAQSKQKFD